MNNINTFIIGGAVMLVSWLIGMIIGVYRKTPWERRFTLTMKDFFNEILSTSQKNNSIGSPLVNWHRDEGRILGGGCGDENKSTSRRTKDIN